MSHIVQRYKNIISIILCCIFAEIVRGKDYLVDTDKCKIPDYQPFNDETVNLWSSLSYKSCTGRPLLSRVKTSNNGSTLYIENHLLPLYGKNITCCVSNILRDASDPQFPDDKISWTKCEPFEHKVELNNTTVMVNCQDYSGCVVYQNVHYAFLKNEKLQAKLNRSPPVQKPLSVLFIVIDSVSRLNFIRTMPKTRNYLLENDFVEMQGYNKIDDNTFPNFVALLTGLNKGQTEEIRCTGRKRDEMDKCPMIWYDFGNAGYVTAYGEDWGNLSTFNFNKKGFTNPPTNFYLRPYVLASESLGTTTLKGAPYCAGPETSGERQLNLALEFGKTFKNSPYFGIFWMNTFSHQALNTPLRFDDKTREFFTNLKAEGILDDAMVVLLSDHGMRIDQTIRRTLPGWFEERLPMNYISMPKWFKEKFPTEYNNLRSNSKELTSTYDFYMTLQNILSLTYPSYQTRSSRACPLCESLFNQIPTRTCREAGIPEEWCTCIGHLDPLNSSDTLVLNAAQFVLDHIKSELNNYNMTNICSNFELSFVKKAGLSETSEKEGEKYIFLNFLTVPYAEYIATLKYQNVSTSQGYNFKLLKNIIRLDRGDYSCISYSRIYQYCNCRSGTIIYYN